MERILVTGIIAHYKYREYDVAVLYNLDTFLVDTVTVEKLYDIVKEVKEGNSDIKIYGINIELVNNDIYELYEACNLWYYESGEEYEDTNRIELKCREEQGQNVGIVVGNDYNKYRLAMIDICGKFYYINRYRVNSKDDIPKIYLKDECKESYAEAVSSGMWNGSCDDDTVGRKNIQIELKSNPKSRIITIPRGIDQAIFKDGAKLDKLSLGDNEFGMCTKINSIIGMKTLIVNNLLFREGILYLANTDINVEAKMSIQFPDTLHAIYDVENFIHGDEFDEFNTGDGVVRVYGVHYNTAETTIRGIVLGKNVVRVSDYAFSRVVNTYRIEIHSNICVIGRNTFCNLSDTCKLTIAAKREAKILIESDKLVKLAKRGRLSVEYFE